MRMRRGGHVDALDERQHAVWVDLPKFVRHRYFLTADLCGP